MSSQYQQTDYNKRRSNVPEQYDPPRRNPSHREPSARSSGGTVSTMMSSHSTGAESADTHRTEPPAYSKKFVVVGDGGCGKTCFLITYSQGHFPEKYVPTVFENYVCWPKHEASGKSLELALWDTAGQEEYDRLRPLSYPETDLIFVCYAIDCPNSLENVMDKWYPEVLHFCPYTPLVLVGLKSDLRTKRTCIDLLKTQGLTPVTPEQGMAVAKKMGARYAECSSKELRNVHNIFKEAIDFVIANDPSNQKRESPTSSGGGGGGGGVGGGMPKKKKRSCKIL